MWKKRREGEENKSTRRDTGELKKKERMTTAKKTGQRAKPSQTGKRGRGRKEPVARREA